MGKVVAGGTTSVNHPYPVRVLPVVCAFIPIFLLLSSCTAEPGDLEKGQGSRDEHHAQEIAKDEPMESSSSEPSNEPRSWEPLAADVDSPGIEAVLVGYYAVDPVNDKSWIVSDPREISSFEDVKRYADPIDGVRFSVQGVQTLHEISRCGRNTDEELAAGPPPPQPIQTVDLVELERLQANMDAPGCFAAIENQVLHILIINDVPRYSAVQLEIVRSIGEVVNPVSESMMLSFKRSSQS